MNPYKERYKSYLLYRKDNPDKTYIDFVYLNRDLDNIGTSIWRQTLPDNLKNTGQEYDMVGAYKAGLVPEYNEEDSSYHLLGRNPETGKILKRINHPTFNKTIEADLNEGYYPEFRNDGLYTIKYLNN